MVMALAITELVAWWWMNPPLGHGASPLLSWKAERLGGKDSEFQSENKAKISWHPELVKEYQGNLHCSSGSICKITKNDDMVIHAALFQWDSSSANAIEAFRHRPDECLGSIGMKFIKAYPNKNFSLADEQLVFAHTLFRDPMGIPIHAFKATWVAGKSSEFSFMLGNEKEWHEQRSLAAWKRFKPDHAQVVQGTIRSVYDPEKAWLIFQESVLSALQLH